ncbi:hypothetical protein EW145_g4254 [Phellinidium pouzarii]|uniref:Uncharacterized protein n=1 Tax=Phellinidium pouzarii TaxID=167371 RepID=A0A4S4L5M0_9AGAM|nr:hypothetical protein EW145_g4254 [Phellinidium pouzarii]
MQYQEYEDSFLASPSHDTQPTVSGTLPLSASQPGLIYEDYPVASIPTTVNVLPVAPEAADIQAAQIQTMMAQASFVDSPQKLIQPSSGSGSSTVEVPRVTIPMQGLISVRFTRGGGSYKAIRHSDVQKWSVLRTTDQRSEISNPHIGGKPGTLPRVLFLAKAEEMERAFKPYIYDLIPGARLKLVILACPICGHCTEEHDTIFRLPQTGLSAGWSVWGNVLDLE